MSVFQDKFLDDIFVLNWAPGRGAWENFLSYLKQAARVAPQRGSPGSPGYDAALASHNSNLSGAYNELQWFAPQFHGYVYRLIDIAKSFNGNTITEVTKPINEFDGRQVTIKYPVADINQLESLSGTYPELSWREKNYLDEAMAIPLLHTGRNDHPEFLIWAKQIARISKQRPDIGMRFAQQIEQDEAANLRNQDSYRSWATDVLKTIGREGVPETITVTDYRIQGSDQVQILQRPEPVTPEMERAFAVVYSRVSLIEPEDYKILRQESLDEVKAKVMKGELEFANAPELMLEAQKAKEDLDADIEAQERELTVLETVKEKARVDRDDALLELKAIQSNTGQLDGFSDSWKRIRRKAKKVWDRNVWEPTKQVRDQVSEAILPSVIREFGRDVNREASRVGRRVNKEINRGIENVATQYGPWLKLVIPFVGLIPGVGLLASWVLAAAVASVEIAHTYRVKRELDGNLRKLKNAVRAQIAEYNNETAQIRAEIERLKKERAAVLVQTQSESRQRDMVTASTLGDLAAQNNVTNLAIGGAAVLAGYSLLKKKHRRLSLGAAVALAAYGVYRSYQFEKEQFSSYDLCLQESGDEDFCRKQWINR